MITVKLVIKQEAWQLCDLGPLIYLILGFLVSKMRLICLCTYLVVLWRLNKYMYENRIDQIWLTVELHEERNCASICRLCNKLWKCLQRKQKIEVLIRYELNVIFTELPISLLFKDASVDSWKKKKFYRFYLKNSNSSGKMCAFKPEIFLTDHFFH